jgi:hypothetical protein
MEDTVSGPMAPEQTRPAGSVANLVIDTLNEFDAGVYTTSTGADYLNGSLFN